MITTTANGAVSFDSSNSSILNYFSKVGTYQNRTIEEVAADMEKIFSEDPVTATKLVFASRLISRKPFSEEENASGFGRKDEFFKAIDWMTLHQNELVKKNLHLIPLFGSWKDFFSMPLLQLPTEWTFPLFRQAVESNDQLFLKYLPQIRSISKIRSERDRARTLLAKKFAKYMGLNPRQYRKLKACGEAHIWQKQMSANEWRDIHFNGIPGKAMLLHASQKGRDHKTVFERHGMTHLLIDWARQSNKVKFTGYPYELLKGLGHNAPPFRKTIIDRQFTQVLEGFRGHRLGNVLACLDTSGSMSMKVANTSAYDVCLSLGLVFANLNEGDFNKKVCMFDEESSFLQLESESFSQQVEEIRETKTAWGGTNFQSVINAIVDYRRKHPEVPIDQYPETLLIISDMQFSPAGDNQDTNYGVAINKLKKVGLGEVRIIWWWVNGDGEDFPVTSSVKNCYMIGGFDPSCIKGLMNLSSENKGFVAKQRTQENPMDGLNNFLSQPIFNNIVLL